MNCKIELTSQELLLGAQCGVLRHVRALQAGYKPKHGAKEDTVWQIHVEGALGEMAFAKCMGWYWDASINTFKAPDIRNIQVRTRSKHAYELIIRKDDRNDVFVLVTGIAPCYTIRGWINGADGKQDKWLQTHGGREKAYFVPQSALHKIEDLG